MQDKKIKMLSILLRVILCMLIKIQHWSSRWILNNRLRWLRCWCRWLGILRNGCWRDMNWRSRLLSYCFLLSNRISLKNKWLRRNKLILCVLHRLLCWHRLLGCGGLTLSRRRRLDSWPSHLCKKLIHTHDRWQAQALEALHNNGLPMV